MNSILFRLFFPIACCVLFTTCEKTGPEDPVDIPKGEFYDLLVELGVDVNGDGSISYAEAENVSALFIQGYTLPDLKGIESLVNLESLWCMDCQLTGSLDLSKNSLLKDLDCSSNNLQYVDVSGLIHLQNLDCSERSTNIWNAQ